MSEVINKIYRGNARTELKRLPANSVDMCVTSPPYWSLRNYNHPDQLGTEPTVEYYIGNLLLILDQVHRVLKPEGTLWLNLGDTLRKKSFQLIPHRVAIALADKGWILRNDIIWAKPNPMPESVKDRFTKSHEHLFFFSKNKKYYFNQILDPLANSSAKTPRQTTNVKERGYITKDGENGLSDQHHGKNISHGFLKNKRDVWTIGTKPFKEAHFAVFPDTLVEPCIKAGCPEGGIVLDPFMGAGTTAVVAKRLGRNYIGVELNQEYINIAERRIANETRVTEINTKTKIGEPGFVHTCR